MYLDRADIEQLIHEPSARMRAALCEKLCKGYNEQAYNAREQELTLEILRLLLRDTSIRVRQTLSESIRHNPHMPRDIVLSLAEDHELVAEAVLGDSPVLDEDDLIAIAESTYSLRKLLAIAGRESLSAPLSHALVQSGEHKVTMRVIENPGAAIDEDTFAWLLDEYYQDDSILEALVYRGGLPYSVAEKLFHLVSKHFRKQLTQRYRLRKQVADDLSENAREISMMRFMSPWMGQQDIRQLVQDMHKQKRLSDSVIIRSLCIGDLRFFQTAMATRAGIGLNNAKILMLDPDGKGFDACYDKAGMPPEFRDAVRTLFAAALEETQLGQFHHEQFTQRVVERIIANGQDTGVEHMPSLLSILGKSMYDVATCH